MRIYKKIDFSQDFTIIYLSIGTDLLINVKIGRANAILETESVVN
jgi:hypothetical protein